MSRTDKDITYSAAKRKLQSYDITKLSGKVKYRRNPHATVGPDHGELLGKTLWVEGKTCDNFQISVMDKSWESKNTYDTATITFQLTENNVHGRGSFNVECHDNPRIAELIRNHSIKYEGRLMFFVDSYEFLCPLDATVTRRVVKKLETMDGTYVTGLTVQVTCMVLADEFPVWESVPAGEVLSDDLRSLPREEWEMIHDIHERYLHKESEDEDRVPLADEIPDLKEYVKSVNTYGVDRAEELWDEETQEI